MPRKYYSAKQIVKMTQDTDKLRRMEEVIKKLKKEGIRKERTGRASTPEQKELRELRQRRREEIGETERLSPAVEKTLEVSKLRGKKRKKALEQNPEINESSIRMARTLKRDVQKGYRVEVAKANLKYRIRSITPKVSAEISRVATSKQPTYQYTKNIRPKKGLLKLAQRLGPTPQLPRGRPDWIYNRPAITGALGATNVFMNHPQTSIIKGKEKKNNDNLFWR